MSPPQRDSQPGAEFERTVAEAYRARGYQVTQNEQMAGMQIDIVARREDPDAPPTTLAIECKDHEKRVGIGLVKDFIQTVDTLRRANIVSGGVLVSRNNFTQQARAAVQTLSFLALLSWDELASRTVIVKHRLEERVKEYENEPIYSEYLHLMVQLLSWGQLSRPSTIEFDLKQLADAWISQNDQRKRHVRLVLLADFGAGKTTFLRHLEFDRAKAHLKGRDMRVPLFVTLANYRESYDVMTLLRASFRDSYRQDITRELLRHELERGAFYLLLDGFDEMVDRSDAQRRAELFHALLPVLRSPCPVVLTSRRSHFVEEGELDALLSMLRDKQTEITVATGAILSPTSARIDRLRRDLIRRREHGRMSKQATDTAPAEEVHVARLLPLDDDRIKAYVQLRTPELEAAGTGPKAVVEFIEHTYDLAELASRPLLLSLIVDTVCENGIDVSAVHIQLGPSGLYELYTELKLNFDGTKRHHLDRGLPVKVRRALAEALAVRMYELGLLEISLPKLLPALVAGSRWRQQTYGMTNAEITTDFATCSFVSVGDDGKCRFSHPSFRAFFVARQLVNRPGLSHPLFGEALKREVLYFIGGFAPTHRTLARKLWDAYERTDPSKRTFRRNMLVAYLYTRPDHEDREVSDVDIADAEFRKLTFARSVFNGVLWHACVIEDFIASDVQLRNVGVRACEINRFVLKRCDVDVRFENAKMDVIEVERCDGSFTLEGNEVRALRLVESRVDVTDKTAAVRKMWAMDSTVSFARHSMSRSLELYFERSRAHISGCGQSAVTAVDSVIVAADGGGVGPESKLERSVLAVNRPTGGGAPVWLGGDADRESIVLSDVEIPFVVMVGLACAFFGVVGDVGNRDVLKGRATGWGVLSADALFAGLGIGREIPVISCGGVLLARSGWYEQQIGVGGTLSAVSELRAYCIGGKDVDRGQEQLELRKLVGAVTGQYEAVMLKDWPTVQEYLPKGPSGAST